MVTTLSFSVFTSIVCEVYLPLKKLNNNQIISGNQDFETVRDRIINSHQYSSARCRALNFDDHLGN
jgi:hypothetical protein